MPPAPSRPSAPATIIGLGADLCAVARFDRELQREASGLLDTVFLPAERGRCARHPHPARAFAACFAAKEAVIKALAPVGGQGTFWRDIEIVQSGGGQAVTLHGRLAALARDAGVGRVVVSSAHCGDYATACAVASG